MIEVVITLIYTAYSVLQTEIEKRQKQAADVTNYVKVLHVLNSAAIFLRDGDSAGLDATVFALNRAVDATPDTEILILNPSISMTNDQITTIENALAKVKEKKVK